MKRYLRRVYTKGTEKYYGLLRKDIVDNRRRIVVTANAETIMKTEEDELLDEMLTDRRVSIVPDGISVVKACRTTGFEVKERITGVGIATELLRLANKYKRKVYLFGATEEVVTSLVEIIKNKYKDIKIIGYSNGYVEDKDALFESIIKLKPDVCLVALGIPEQEKLIYKNIDKIKKGIYVGVGGSFDVLSGYKKRAPKFFIKHNLEWLYRIFKEPKRLKRFFKYNVRFMYRAYLD